MFILLILFKCLSAIKTCEHKIHSCPYSHFQYRDRKDARGRSKGGNSKVAAAAAAVPGCGEGKH